MENNQNTARKLTEIPEDPFELNEESLEQLKARAEALGVQLQTEDKSEIIEKIIMAATPPEADLDSVEVGQLFSIHSKTEEALKFVQEARKRILFNEDNPRVRPQRLMLKNRNGEVYSRHASYVQLKRETALTCIEKFVVIPEDAIEQKQMVEDYKADPSKFHEPILVRLYRQNTRSTSEREAQAYVMLYMRRRQERPQGPVTF